MKRVTRNIDPEDAKDLLERVPRACIAFACDHGPQAQSIVLVWQDGRYLAGIPEGADRQPNPGQEVVLLIDEGVHFFEALCHLHPWPAKARRGSEECASLPHLVRGGPAQASRLGLRNASRGER